VDTRSRSQTPTILRSSNDDVEHVNRRNPTQPDFSSASFTSDQVVDNVLHMPDGFDEKLVEVCTKFTPIHGANCTQVLNKFKKHVTLEDLNQFLRMNGTTGIFTCSFEETLKQFKGLVSSKAECGSGDIEYKMSEPNFWMNKLFYNLELYGYGRSVNVYKADKAYTKLTIAHYRVLCDVIFNICPSSVNEITSDLFRDKKIMTQLIKTNLDVLMNIKFDLRSLVGPPKINRKLAREAYEKGLAAYEMGLASYFTANTSSMDTAQACIVPDTANTSSMDTAQVCIVPDTPIHRCSTCPPISCNDSTCCCAPSVNRVSTNTEFEDDTPSAVNTDSTNIVFEDDTPSVARMFLYSLFITPQSP